MPNASKSRRLGAAYVYGAAAIWSTIGVAAKIGYSDGITPFGLTLVRVGFISLLALGASLISIRYRGAILSPKVALTGMAVIAPFYYAYLEAVREAGVALAVVLLYTAPAWVIVFESLYKRPSMLETILAASSMIGVALVNLGAGEGRISLGGIAWGVASGVLYALTIIVSKRLLAAYEPLQLALGIQAWATPILVPAAFILGVGKPGLLAIASGLYLSLAVGIGAYYMFYNGLRLVPSSTAAIAATLEPLLAVAWGIVLFGENLPLIAWVGAALILGSQAALNIGWGRERGKRERG